MERFKQNKLALIFLVIGAVGGFLYWKFVGCTNEACVVTSVWYWSVLWGGAAGYLVGDTVSDILKKREKKNQVKDDSEV